MERRRCWRMGLPLLSLALGMHPAVAQTGGNPRSHVPLPGNSPQTDLQKLLEGRLQQLGQRPHSQLPDTVQQLLQHEQFKQFISRLQERGISANDPRLLKELEQFLQQRHPEFVLPKLSDEDRTRLQQMAQQLVRDGKLPDQLPLDMKPPRDPDISLPPPPMPSEQKPFPDPETLNRTRAQLERWSKRLEGMASKLETMPSVQEALRGLARDMIDMQRVDIPAEERLDVQLAQLHKMSKDAGAWFREGWKSLRKLDWPDLPQVDWPKLNLTPPDLPSVDLPSVPALPRVTAPTSPSSETWPAIGLVMALVLLGLTLLRLAGRLPTPWAQQRDAWRLGPWPIHPSAITTREDLIRAFEYLALLRLGRDARAWNHRIIASQLGEREVWRRAADNVAMLYAQARYTPDHEALSAEAIVAARRDLCLLAGVPAT